MKTQKDSQNTMDKVKKPNFKKTKNKPFLDRAKSKAILKEKRARLVVKNLSFKATEESVRKYFEEYGQISNVELLKKPDGRNLEVDFAKPKNVYNKEKQKSSTAKEEVEVKQESIDTSIISIKDEDLEEKPEITDEKPDVQNSGNGEDSEVDSDNNEDCDTSSIVEKKPFMSRDVSEGKTIFVKNVPYDATGDDLKKCFLQYGSVYYALICIDKMTEHSKGTAFVKFVNKEDAEKALSAGTELTLLGNILDCHPAIDQNDLKNKLHSEKENKSKPKDSRNLYLVKEGVILAGTKAAQGLSQSDMAKRLQIEQYKTQMLKKLNTFVSKNRLKHGGKGCVIKEARIMRNMRNLDAKGVGESKQYGFVTFTTHEHALAALRSLNNNPNIFTPHKRPIVTFSIENKTALNAKIKRQQKSKFKNPNSKDYDPNLAKENTNTTGTEVECDVKPFSGITAKEGTIQKMRSRYKLGVQAKLHYENIKKEKRKQKMTKKSLAERKKDFIRQPKQKMNNKSKDDNFSKLVNDYKKMLTSDVAKKSKWYE
ncbi:hypothetical protein GWI33_000174 [Rhynchophorus ferrugineus]|uniref:RRM domain-containing protein n=1 Tax=Rhynchophorus ferrugineus TaxID=354439 RepID=A0A834MM46_RHYFE|nr:hypothetical protein GWI33_000174 [Rhynchophorus ferrugineus]